MEMDKRKMKMGLLKMLMDEMMEEHDSEMSEGKEDMYKSMMGPDTKMKAVIKADSKEGLIEGAKKIPEALSTADEYMKKRFGDKKK